VLPLDCGQDFDASRDAQFFAALPVRAAVFVVEPRAEGRVYLGRTADLRRRLTRLLGTPEEHSKRLNLREIAARVRYRLTGSPFEQALLLYQHARVTHPKRYRDFLRMRPAALLKLNLRNEYPRCYVTRRILADDALYVGPFQSRKFAETYSGEFLNLFKIRRCQIKIRRDPTFPGCIYSEMKMCLAPCFAGCSKEEYDVEVGRVRSFLESSGESLPAEIEREREAASEALDFERAAALHKKLEKVAGVLRGVPELPRPIGELDAILLQPAAEENAVVLFAVQSGRIAEPFVLRFAELQSEPRSVEEILREALPSPRPHSSSTSAAGAERADLRIGPYETERNLPELADHLALLARWYYGKPRIGEIFFARPARGVSRQPEWPLRRIIRAASRLLNPPDVPAATPEPPGGAVAQNGQPDKP
jgi:excinuclease UvrABC nuclease subunit